MTTVQIVIKDGAIQSIDSNGEVVIRVLDLDDKSTQEYWESQSPEFATRESEYLQIANKNNRRNY